MSKSLLIKTMSFNDLSIELWMMIVRQVHRDSNRLAHLAAVSRTFQDAIERLTFASLDVDSEDVEQLTRLLQDRPERCAAISKIKFTVVLPMYPGISDDSDEAYDYDTFETLVEQDFYSKHFSHEVASLFETLALRDRETAKGILLEICSPYAPSDHDDRDKRPLQSKEGSGLDCVQRDLSEFRLRHSHVGLLGAEGLPKIDCVKALKISDGRGRHFEPAVAGLLASKFPNLASSSWEMDDDNGRMFPARRIQMRSAFAEALVCSNEGSSAGGSLDFAFCHMAPNDHAFDNTDLRDDKFPGLDSFSVSLGNYVRSQNLVEVNLMDCICIGSEFWWHENADSTNFLWPNLKSINVQLSAVAPSGAWYLDRDPFTDFEDYDSANSDAELGCSPPAPGEDVWSDREWSLEDQKRINLRIGDFPWRTFRVWPSLELIGFFRAMARAAYHMPSLERMETEIGIVSYSRPGSEWGSVRLFVAKKGSPPRPYERFSCHEHSQLQWRMPRPWKMDKLMLDLWKTALEEDMVVAYEYW